MMDFKEFKGKYQKAEVEHHPSCVSNSPIVSILVQTYNHEKYIEKCLSSILSQNTSFDFEIILGEDYSTDNTRNICIKYANKYPDKIRLFLHHPKNKISVNGILTGNFNAFYNLFSAQGKYIAFCEGDDYWEDPTKLQKQVDFLERNPMYVLTYHSYNYIDSEGNSLNQDKFPLQPRKDITSEELKKNQVHPLLQTMCFRNSFKRIPEEAARVINLDSFFLSLLGLIGNGKYHSDIEPSIYRIQNEGIWSKRKRKDKLKAKLLLFRNLQLYYIRINREELVKHYSQVLRNHRKMLITKHFKEGEFLLGVQELLKYLGGKT